MSANPRPCTTGSVVSAPREEPGPNSAVEPKRLMPGTLFPIID
jgi:hypothetical protein